MDFANFSEASVVVTKVVVGLSVVVVVVTVLIPVMGTAFNGMISISTFCSFSLTNFSNSTSISLIYAFCSMINFNISSLWPSVSTIYFARGSSVVGIFNYFLREAISTFFFLRSSSVAFTFDGSYPILRTSSSKDFILLYFAKEDTFSSFSCVWTLFKETCNFAAVMEVLARVDKIISLVYLCISI
jgi:hypothetical protein